MFWVWVADIFAFLLCLWFSWYCAQSEEVPR